MVPFVLCRYHIDCGVSVRAQLYIILNLIARTQSFKMGFKSSSPLWAAIVLAGLSSARKCTDLTVEVPVVSRNAVFNRTAPTDDIEVTNFVLDLTRQGHNLTQEALTGVSPCFPT